VRIESSFTLIPPLEVAMIDIVSATRLSESNFWGRSALGISLRRLAHETRLVARVSFENQRGLPEIYNESISAGGGADMLVFVHDDVWIDDYFLADRVIEGLRTYDVIGVTGNRRKVENQPAWSFVDTRFTWDDRVNLSGAIAFGKHPFGPVSYFGEVPADCETLDGCFLAARKAALKEHGVFFDPCFDFHLYDMDFCRSARQRGLHLGTWPICLTHQSGGAFGTPQWNQSFRAYIEKWGS
jgi:GT2 family glycosyltransferase